VQLLPERLRAEFGRRATGLVLALALEAILILLLLTLGRTEEEKEEPRQVLSTFDASAAPEEQAAPEPQPQEPEPTAQETPVPRQPDQPEPAPVPARPAPALIPVPQERMDSFDISRIPSPDPVRPAPSRPVMGPADTRPRQADTPRVGTAPNGEPLYAAQWYREPYDSELAGYLSTAQGPGWGLIACRTAPEYRVEDCVALDEYPANSRIARAVLAAAWQFKVRPPRLGGRPMVGEWVRIRIDYGIRREPRP